MLKKLYRDGPKRNPLVLAHLGAILALCCALPARAQISTWTGAAADGGNWNNATNWNPAAIPNSPTAAISFAGAGLGNVIINSSVAAQSLTFTNPTGGYTLTSISGQTLSGISGITIGSAVIGAETINLASVPTGSLLVPGTGLGALSIINNAASTPATTPTLLIGPSTVIARLGAGNPGLTFSGTGTTRVSGNIGTGISTGLAKTGPGSLTLSGDNSASSGGATLSGGSLTLDYSTSATAKFPAGALNLNGGDLSLKANAITAFTENLLPAVLNPGHTAIVLSANGGTAGINLNLNFLNRNPGGTIDIKPDTNSNVLISTGTLNGIIGGWATANGGASWATRSGSNVVMSCRN